MKKWFAGLFTINHPTDDGRRRGQILVSMSIGIVVIVVLALPVLFFVPSPLEASSALILALAVGAACVWLAQRGRVGQAGWLMAIGTLVTVSLPMFLRGSAGQTVIYLIVPVLIASIVLRPTHIMLIVLAAWAMQAYIAVTLPDSPAASGASINVTTTVMIMICAVIGFVNARITSVAFGRLSDARATIEDNSAALKNLNASLEGQVKERTAALETALQDVQARSTRQEQLLGEIEQQRSVIQDMSVPVLPVAARVLVMPLVGELDTARLDLIHDKALNAIQSESARYLVLDITGVPVVDSQVAQGLISVIESVRLLGAETIVVGVRPEVAQAIVTLGLGLDHVRTSATLQEGLRLINQRA